MIGPGWGLALSVGTLVLATLFGLIWRSRQGRVPGTRTATTTGDILPEPVLTSVDDTAAVTLLQLTIPICARCPRARTLLSDLATETPGVGYAELDLAGHPELAGQLGIRSTPTTLVVSRTGQELFRVAGVPRRAELLTALQPHL
ncbi:MAG TPA: thioredoxin domain-containing protein [Pseudonocardiaceae bacterium]|jgi:thioredoxin-like negative regulator of GroEL